MKQNAIKSQTVQRRDNRTSEELIHLYEATFKDSGTSHANDAFIGLPPAFEFKKVTMWKDVPVSYSTRTHARGDYA